MASDMDSFLKELEKEIRSDIKSSNKEVREFYGVTADEKELKKAAEKLKSNLETYIKHYFDTYHAKTANGYDWRYKGQSFHYDGRTGQLLDSVLIDVNSTGDGLSAKVYFDESKAYRKSLFGQGNAYIPQLLNDGYAVSSGWHKTIHHFGYFEGTRFIEAAIIEARHDSLFNGVEIIYEPYGDYGMNI